MVSNGCHYVLVTGCHEVYFCVQWANHDRSLKLEEETKKNIMYRMEEKVSSGEGTWIDWQYLLDAVVLLRKVLVICYA